LKIISNYTKTEGWLNRLPTILFIVIFCSAIYQSYGATISYIVTTSLILLSYLFFSDTYSIKKYQAIFIGLLILYFYSIFTSTLVARSSIVALGMSATFLFFCVINDQNKSFSKATLSKNEHITERSDYLLSSIYAFTFIALVHSLILIAQYIIDPTRQTGLLRDYSQASLFILIAFGLIYPIIKKKTLSTPIALILFLGFFTTFSRTANFLLIIFLISLLFLEYKNQTSKYFIKAASLIFLSAALVYLYPLTIESEVVNRGGLKDIATLNSRTTYWQAAWQAFIQKPLTGHGLHTYQFTGITTLLPYHRIYNIHNDYLQVLHDLGIFWFVIFTSSITALVIKFAPFLITISQPKFQIEIKAITDAKFLSWVLLLCMSAYMLVNFILLSPLFQLAFALICVVLLNDDKT